MMTEWTTAGSNESPKSQTVWELHWADKVRASPDTLRFQITFDYLHQILVPSASHCHTSVPNGDTLVWQCHPSIKSWMMWQVPFVSVFIAQLTVSEGAPCQAMPQRLTLRSLAVRVDVRNDLNIHEGSALRNSSFRHGKVIKSEPLLVIMWAIHSC